MLISVDKTRNRFISNRPLFRQRSVQLEFFVPAKCKTLCSFIYLTYPLRKICCRVGTYTTPNAPRFTPTTRPACPLRFHPAVTSTIMADFEHVAIKSKSAAAACGWNFIVLMSRQGKIRLSEFFSSYTESQKKRILRDIAADVLPRQAKMCNIIEKGEFKFVYRRYASLYFIVGAPVEMNELIVLEQIHIFVEALDGYFNSGE